MIVYKLRCEAGHEFDGWFKNSDTYDRQSAAGRVSCAICGGSKVAKAPMAPRVSRGLSAPAEATAAESVEKTNSGAGGGTVTSPAAPPTPVGPMQSVMPPDPREIVMRQMLREIRRRVEANCDYVGPSFAAEARRIHEGEAEKRGIYGEATPDEVEALAEDGIEVGQVPWLPHGDA